MVETLNKASDSADSPAPKRILIADDDGAIRGLLCDFLGGEGFEMLEARSGKEVLQTTGAESPDLLLLDLRMPDWDGMEVMRRLKERDLSVPVVLMTAYGTSSSAIQAIQLGAFDYITKPFELDDVLLTVKRFFEHDQLASEVRKLRGQLEGRDPSLPLLLKPFTSQQLIKTVRKALGDERH